jgi:hypothetical protein
MELPLEVTYRALDPSDALSRLIADEADKLETFYDRIVSCRVVVEREYHHLREGAPYRVRIFIAVPGEELVVDSVPGTHPAPDDASKRSKSGEVSAMYKDPALAVRDAFRRAKRRLQDFARRRAGPHVRASIR